MQRIVWGTFHIGAGMSFDTTLCEHWEEPLEVGLTALALGLATVEDLQAAAVARRQTRPVIGQLAIKTRRLSIAQVFRILGEQGITGERFGEAALRLGAFDAKQLYELLRLQADLTPPLSDVLLDRGVLTKQEAEMLRTKVAERLRSGQPNSLPQLQQA